MASRQRIIPIRRDYNQWVANQTMEDYALRFTAKSARRWSSWRVANTALGAISFLALEAIGGTITVNYGFANAAAAIVCGAILIFAIGLPIAYYAARYGVDIDLLTRGAGFGYIGSTITSLIYASFTFIFFAIEAAILASTLEACFGLPLWLGYIVCAVVVIPLVMHGITFISRLQRWTQPVWLMCNLLPFAFILPHSAGLLEGWTAYRGSSPHGFDPLLFGAAASVVLSLVAQIGEQVDFLRFLPVRPNLGEAGLAEAGLGGVRGQTGRAWWMALLAAGPGWIVPGAVKLLAGSLLAYLVIQSGLPPGDAVKPNEMYRVAFSHVVASPTAALVFASAFVALSQIKINVTNAYAGSIAWSNFFSRLTHRHPGRVVWVVFNIAIALLLMELGVYEAIEHTLAVFSDVAAGWVGAIVADLVINKTLGFSPPGIEFKRAHLYDINPVGTCAMLLAVSVALLAHFGMFGALAQAFSPFVALAVAFVTAPLIAWATDGRYYLARKPRAGWGDKGLLQCVVCENAFEPEDSAYCPVYQGAICSLCCSLDSRCQDGCKPQARYSSQLMAPVRALMPAFVIVAVSGRIGRYAAVFVLLAAAAAAALLLIYGQVIGMTANPGVLRASFLRVFFLLLAVAAVLAWLLVLGREGQDTAREETHRQTALLLSEIEAHGVTGAALQRAREVAEAANLAKSRYVTGISHELRTPLNAILGYAQLMEGDDTIPRKRRDGIRIIRRSGEHLAALVDGLLDISKIEAGRIELYRDRVRLPEFLDQTIDMFQLSAAAKAIDLVLTHDGRLPAIVRTDERRLRQILINLLSNAIKFTQHGRVSLRVRWRDDLAELDIEDTGIGIAPQDLERIFEPFQRIEDARAPYEAGVGLGLTITRLLTQIMGGDIRVESEVGRGTRFHVRLMLSEVQPSSAIGGDRSVSEQQALGYAGRPRRVMVTDDDPVHRGLMEDLLIPLGFQVSSAVDGPDCLRSAARIRPDLFLLDVALPGMNGWELARHLRQDGFVEAPIIMISANAGELSQIFRGNQSHDDVLAKPVTLAVLLEKIGRLLQVQWRVQPRNLDFDGGDDSSDPGSVQSLADRIRTSPPGHRQAAVLPLGPDQIASLRELAMIGYIRGLRERLDMLEQETPGAAAQIDALRNLVADFRLDAFLASLDAASPDVSPGSARPAA